MKQLWARIDSVLPLPRHQALGIAPAVAMGLAAAASAVFLRAALNVSLPFLPVIVAVVVAAARGGLMPALLVEGVGLPAVLWLVPTPGITDNAKGIAVLVAVLLVLGVAGEMVARVRFAASVDLCRLQQRETYLQSIFDTLPASLVVTDDDGHVLAANSMARRLFGDNVTDPDRNGIGEILRQSGNGRSVDRVAGSPHMPEDMVTAGRPDGEDLELAMASANMIVGDHRFRTIYFRDVTERRRLELRLDELRAEVEQLGRASALGQFGTAIAHELNQPLATAALYGDALRAMLNRGQGAEAIDTVDLILKQVFRAQAVLDRLRDFVSASQPRMEWVAASAILAETTELAQMAVRQVAADISVEIDPVVGELMVDRVRVQQVLLNLILNALDAVRGRPQRQLRLSVASEAQGMARITLADTGPGVSPAILDRLFKPFVTGKPDGLGVGLAITRSIVETHGGRIWYEPADPGARFHFTVTCRGDEGPSDAG